MPRLWGTELQPSRLPPDDSVEAITDLQYGRRWVPQGTRLERSDPLVADHPEVFQVRYRLDQERSE
jgi:hypothetical protein